MEIKVKKRKKNNNNLICVNAGNEKHYFTSTSRAGTFLGLAAGSVQWAIDHKNVLINNKDEEVTIDIIDGSEIPYKLINN